MRHIIRFLLSEHCTFRQLILYLFWLNFDSFSHVVNIDSGKV